MYYMYTRETNQMKDTTLAYLIIVSSRSAGLLPFNF